MARRGMALIDLKANSKVDIKESGSILHLHPKCKKHDIKNTVFS
jgi:hypothetical protein